MWKNIKLEDCLSHIHRQRDDHSADSSEIRPAITISRMCGSGGRTVASKLAEYLEPHAPYGRHWTVFDRSLIKKVLEDHSESVRLAEFLTESRKPLLAEIMEKLRGRKSLSDTVAEQTVETIWQLAVGGHVILVGRGANVITAKLPNVFHVRLVGSLENRIERIEEVYDMDRHAALAFIKSQDEAKRSYLREYFGQDIENPQLYHLIVNTDRISYDHAAEFIADAVVNSLKIAPALTGK
jgi:cytidylate kinase